MSATVANLDAKPAEIAGDLTTTHLAEAVRGSQAQGAWARAIPVAGVLSVGCALAVGLGATWACSMPPVLALALGAWRPSAARAAARLDGAAQLDGALVCAWDHRAQDGLVVRAQRRRALLALAAQPAARAWARPSSLWLLALALWAWPGSNLSGAESKAAKNEPPAAVEATLGAATAASPSMPAPPAAVPTEAEAHGAGAAPPAPAPDAGVLAAEDGGIQAGTRTGSGEGDGVGTRAGDQNGGGGSAVAASPGSDAAAPGLAVPWARAVGALGEIDGPLGPAAVPLGLPPDDGAVVDPARPYPPRYRGSVQRWFALRAQRTVSPDTATDPPKRIERP